MSKILRRRPSPAFVIAIIALFVAMSGTGYAIRRASIGPAQLKSNAVTTKKIKKRAVTRSRLADKAVGTDQIGDDAATGAKVLESSLGTVPNATNAVNASTVAGQTIQRFRFRAIAATGATQLLNVDGLTLTASCATVPTMSVTATTAVSDAIIHSGGTYVGPTAFYAEDDNFDTSDAFDPLLNGTTGSDSVQGTLSYVRTDTDARVTATFIAEESSGFCTFAGTAIN